jgi:vacuolar-type H+-ATPase subunit I/STV1
MKISKIVENIQESRKKVKAAYNIENQDKDIKAILAVINNLQIQNLHMLTVIEKQQEQIDTLNKIKDNSSDYLGGLDSLYGALGVKKKY